MPILLENLKESDKGREVLFHHFDSHTEKGKIKTWNSRFIFVQYWSDIIEGYRENAVSTKPEDLTFVE